MNPAPRHPSSAVSIAAFAILLLIPAIEFASYATSLGRNIHPAVITRTELQVTIWRTIVSVGVFLLFAVVYARVRHTQRKPSAIALGVTTLLFACGVLFAGSRVLWDGCSATRIADKQIQFLDDCTLEPAGDALLCGLPHGITVLIGSAMLLANRERWNTRDISKL